MENTTHCLQPLDNLVFAAFKRKLYSIVDEKLYASSICGFTLDPTIIPSLLDAWNQSVSEEVIRKAFEITGLAPFSAKTIRALLKANHMGEESDGSDGSSTEEFSGDEIANQAVKGVRQVLSNIIEPQKQLQQQLKTVRTPVQRYIGYSPMDVIQQHQNREKEKAEKQLAKENARKQRELEANERKKQKEEANKRREEERVTKRREKELRDIEKANHLLAHTCAAGCGKTCRTGPGWVGCEKCDLFWVCPDCYSQSKYKRKLTLHEKSH